jgi:GTPase SAR1 family protein
MRPRKAAAESGQVNQIADPTAGALHGCRLGASSVGKPSIMQRFVPGLFKKKTPATINLSSTTIWFPSVANPSTARSGTWGTAEIQGDLSCLLAQRRRCRLVFDLTDLSPFDTMSKWFEEPWSNCVLNIYILVVLKGNANPLIH